MKHNDLRARTRDFGVRVIKMVDHFPNKRAANIIANQIIRSATSVGANYREACRARSTKEFISKLGIAEGEADETLYWLEVIASTELIKKDLLVDLMKEADELIAILIASAKTAKQKKN